MNTCVEKVQNVSEISDECILHHIHLYFYLVQDVVYFTNEKLSESDSDESDSDIEEAEKADENPDPNKPKPYQMHHA